MVTSVKKPKTTARKTTARKTTTSKAKPRHAVAAQKPAAVAKKTSKPAVKKAVSAVTAAPQVTIEEPTLRKKELIERVVARSGVKKKDAKPTIEAMLAVLGEALAAGEVLNLQPLGKVMVKRNIEKPNAKIMVCRVRQRKENAGGVVTIVPNI